VKYFFIGNQKIVLFPKFRKNDWEAAARALRVCLELCLKNKAFKLKSIFWQNLNF
jgi:hypothetical protein